jgi:hypothetical protein
MVYGLVNRSALLFLLRSFSGDFITWLDQS